MDSCRYFSSSKAFILSSLVASQNAFPYYIFSSGKTDLDSSLPSLCHLFLLPHQSSAMFLCKCSHLWGNTVRQISKIRGAKNKLSRKKKKRQDSWAGKCRSVVNPQTKGALQNKMKERSGTQMCVSEGERLRMSLFPLKRMDWRPDDGRSCRKYKIIYRKKVWLCQLYVEDNGWIFR